MGTGQRHYKIGRCFGTQRREGEASQRELNHWQTQATKAQKKVSYWESEHSVNSEELVRRRKSQRQWKRKAKAMRYNIKKN